MVSMPSSSRSSRSRAAGNGTPKPACSRSHQPAPTPDERPAAAQRVEGGDRLGDDAGRPQRHRRDQGAETQAGVEPGEQAERDVRLGDRLPRPADLGDLDQVVHQRDAGEAEPRRPPARRRVSQPAGSSPHGNRETWSTTSTPGGRTTIPAPRELRQPRPVGGRSARDRARPWSTTTSQPSAASSSATAPHPLELAGERRRRHGHVAGGVAAPALGVGVANTTATAGSPACRASASQPARRTGSRPRVSTTVQSPRPTRAATTCSRSANASAEASRSWSPLPTTPRSASDETISCGAVAPGGPGRLARPGRADEDDQRRVGQPHGGSLAASDIDRA